jgi:hypothetical protein
MIFSSMIKEKKDVVLDKSKFHLGCAYFVQWNARGGSWFTGILTEVNEKRLRFTIWNGEDEYIELEDLKDPNNNYQITLLVPTNDEEVICKIKQENPIGYDQYIDSRKSYMK